MYVGEAKPLVLVAPVASVTTVKTTLFDVTLKHLHKWPFMLK